MINEVENPWKILDTEEVYSSLFISVFKHNVLNPKGNPTVYSKVNFKNLAIGILPLDKNLNTWIVGQYRFPVNEYSWEIPEGGGNFNVPPLDSAKRELSEETGITAKNWKLIQEFKTSNSITNESAFIFLAQDLEFHESHPDDDEELQVKKLPFEELYQMVLCGDITDSLTLIAVHKTKYLIDNNLL